MKKIFLSLTLIALIICSLSLAGCRNSVKVDSFNSHVVTIYEEVYTQDENGKITFEGLKLKKSFQVPKTQMFELDVHFYEKNEQLFYGTYYYDIDGEYDKDLIYDEYFDVNTKKVTIFPLSDLTITMRKREQKDVKVYYNGYLLTNFFYNSLVVEQYNQQFYSTYEESFYLYTECFDSLLRDVRRSVVVELYTTPEFYGEPFCSTEFKYENEQLIKQIIEFKLIETTDVYLRIY